MLTREKSSPVWRDDRLKILLDRVTRSHGRAVMFLIIVSLLAFLPGFFNTPPIDRDEARFAQATKQMIESGDYVDIRFQNEVRYKKPVGIYWLQAAVVRVAETVGVPEARTRIWLYRIPSLLGAIGAVLLTYWTALAFGTRRTAYLAALMMACSVLLSVEARLAKTDAILLLCTIAAMGALARVYLAGQRTQPVHNEFLPAAVFWTALAGGILLKGPLILLVVGLALATLIVRDRTANWLGALRPLLGIAWLLLLVVPWFLSIAARSGDTFFSQSVGQDLLSKILTGQESHGAPPGYYAVLMWVTFWPAAPLVLLAAPAVWRSRREPETAFLLAWLVPCWVVFELVITKLPHYVLPLYPALAILIARTMEQGALSSDRRLLRGTAMWMIFAVLIPLIAIIGVMIIRKQPALLAWPLAALAMILGMRAWRLYENDGAEASLLRATVAAQLVYFTVFGVVFTTLRPVFPSIHLARILRGSSCDMPRAASAGFHEPSLVFLAGTSTVLTDGAGAADFLRGGECRFAFVEARHERSFANRADATGARYALVSRVEGLNVTGMRIVSIAVYRSERTE